MPEKKNNPETNEILEILLKLPTNDFIFWGGLMKDAIEAKIQEATGLTETIHKKKTIQLNMKIKQLEDKLEKEMQHKYQLLEEERKKKYDDMKEIRPLLLDIIENTKKPEKSVEIGAEGENFVLEWLKTEMKKVSE